MLRDHLLLICRFRSWDVVGGPADQEIIVDPKQRKTEGIAGQLHRSLSRTFSRRKGKDASPVGTASLATSTHTTRTSRANSQGSGTGEYLGQQPIEAAPSYGPSSYHDPTNVSDARKGSLSSSILSAGPAVVLEPGQNSPMPQADLSDPRFHHPKLFPAAGVLPPMLQQATDSVVPTLKSMQALNVDSVNNRPNASGQPPLSASYYELSSRSTSPTSVPGSSMGKKSWLAEAFFAPTGGLHKKKPSISEMMRRKPSHSGPIADPRRPDVGGQKQQEDQSLAKSAGGVSEVSKVQPLVSPPHIDWSDAGTAAPELSTPAKAPLILGTSQKTQQVIQRLDDVLALSPDDADRPDVLDDPPRRLVLCSPMLQVVNGHVSSLNSRNVSLQLTIPFLTPADRQGPFPVPFHRYSRHRQADFGRLPTATLGWTFRSQVDCEPPRSYTVTLHGRRDARQRFP